VSGPLNTGAASISMTTMYLARIARQDLLRAVGSIATQLTRWDETNDKQLFRLVSYLEHSKYDRQVGFVGDDPKDLRLVVYSDADFAGDRATMKSTTGIFLVLVGPTRFPPSAL
jgi:hypothetical protein